jgi:HEAT repeat protein
MDGYIEALSSTNPWVREKAVSALGEMGAGAQAALEPIDRLKNDQDNRVRVRAKWAAEEIRRQIG